MRHDHGRDTGLVQEVGRLRSRIRQLEQVLRQQHRGQVTEPDRYRSFYVHCPFPYLSLGPNGHLLEVNDAWLKALNYQRHEVVGRWFGEFLSEETRRLFQEQFIQFKATGKIKDVLLELVDGHGAVLLAEFNGTVSYDASGHFQYSHCVLQDVTDREQTQRKLQQTLDAIIDGIWYWNLSTNEMSASPHYYTMLGYEPDEFPLTFENWLDLIHPDDREAALAVAEAYLRTTPDLYENEFRMRTKRGDYRWIYARGTVSRWTSEGAPVFVGSHEDFTEKKLAASALVESEQKYRAFIEHSPDVIMRFDRQGRHLFVSPRVTDYVALHPIDFLGKTHDELGFLAKDCRLWRESLDQVFSSKRPAEREFEFEGKKGSVFFNWRFLPEIDETGDVQYVLTVARDITQHRKIERRYKMLFEQMLDGFASHEIILNDQGDAVDYRFRTVNPAFERLTGLKKDKIAGRTVLDILPDTERFWIETYGRVVATGEPIRFDHYSQVLDKHYEVVAFRTQPDQFACIFVDITDRKRAEKHVMDYQARLKALAAELTLTEEREKQCLAEALHDTIQQDIAFSLMTVQMLEASSQESETRDGLATVADVLSQTIESIRSLTFNLSPQILKDLGLAKAVATWLRDQVQKKHDIQTTLNTEGNLPVLTWVKEVILFRSIRELLANAIKHGHPRAIQVTIVSVPSSLEIIVEDNGCGFDTSILMEESRVHGFGLFSIRERLDQLGGSVDITSQGGQGTRVVLSVPMETEGTELPD